MIPIALQEKLVPLVGKISEESPVGGGCIHHAVRIETALGPFFMKWNEIGQAHNFHVEARGLELLTESGNLAVPQILDEVKGGEYAGLVLQWIEQGDMANDYFEVFGGNLARLHQQTAHQFGLPYDNYIGSLPQYNTQHDKWTDFFRESRLLPQLRMEKAKALLSSQTHKAFETLFVKIDSLIPEEKPAFLHGDLWGGNILKGANGQAVIIDPAVYFGHREAEIAFMRLFDTYPQKFYDAYESVNPLVSGWEERVDLFNLYPLLVHVNLFGGGYVEAVERIVKRYV
ncbi:fructosamine kinase family protein [bacterium]|nr:fructosamine kinase family protein [bacterium]